jgi:hypothetical protein
MIAKTGERVMDAETGKAICHVKNMIAIGDLVKAVDFYEFAVDETPWVTGQELDRRCTRFNDNMLGFQIFVEGEWRP